jgi:hypothetical protein
VAKPPCICSAQPPTAPPRPQPGVSTDATSLTAVRSSRASSGPSAGSVRNGDSTHLSSAVDPLYASRAPERCSLESHREISEKIVIGEAGARVKPGT